VRDVPGSPGGEPRDPGAPTPRTEVVETHASTLFFVGERVYKLRKPVRFGFLDFRSRATRQEDCQREVALNRRLAPDVYLGVADLSLEGEPIDHLVVMRRLPDDDRLAALARRGRELDPWLRRVARRLATFHAAAARSPEIAAHATAGALRAVWLDGFAQTEPFVGTVLTADVEAEIRSSALRWLAGRGPLLDARIRAGRVCDGHGDLQAEDIFCLDDGVRILDCLQFSDRLRHGDVCADVCFLAMDLERLGRADAARRFLEDYQELAGDPFPATLVHHYTAARAYVRATVACLRAAQGDPEATDEARSLQALAFDHLRQARVRLVLVGGPPGTGKSTLARGLAAARGWTVVRSDEVRRAVGGAGPDGAGGAGPDGSGGAAPGFLAGRYRPETTAAVYRELLVRAERLLGCGESVVLDASWVDAGRRGWARDVADATGSDLVEILCRTSSDEAARRIARRSARGDDVSEATPEVGAAMARRMDPWPSATVVDTSDLAPGDAVARALGAL
jgi:uncharacterized protein